MAKLKERLRSKKFSHVNTIRIAAKNTEDTSTIGATSGDQNKTMETSEKPTPSSSDIMVIKDLSSEKQFHHQHRQLMKIDSGLVNLK